MLRILIVLLVLLGPAGCAHGDAPQAPLDVLLTNDDGYDAAGLQALRRALLEEGYSVTVVAPEVNRSGSSVSLTTDAELRWRTVEPGVIAVDGTPADCTRLALTVFRREPPDLVVSGVNFGQNLGAGTVVSGTVGAAVTAAALGTPAIAVSQTVDPNDVRGTPRYFPAAADAAVAIVRVLEARADGRLLPPGMVLNVNHPPRVAADVEGVRLTRQGSATLYEVVYTRAGEGRARPTFAPSARSETVANADTTAIAEGFVSVTPLDGSWTADASFDEFEELARTLDALLRPVPAID